MTASKGWIICPEWKNWLPEAGVKFGSGYPLAPDTDFDQMCVGTQSSVEFYQVCSVEVHPWNWTIIYQKAGRGWSHLANHQSPHSFASPKHSAFSPLVACGWNYSICSINAQQSLFISLCCVISVRFPGSSVFWKRLAFWFKLEACRCWCILEWSDLIDLEIFWFI